MSQAVRQPRQRIAGRVFTTSGFFVLRSPVLPVGDFLALSENLTAPDCLDDDDKLSDALRVDRELVRGRLAAALRRPDVREALYVASPSLEEQLDTWNPEADNEAGRQLAHGLNRYFCRMACRPTPFGLFAGCSFGRVGRTAKLDLGPGGDYRRHSRLDMNYLSNLFQELEKDSGIRAALRYEPNPNLYQAAERLRYTESRVDGTGRSHHLVAVERTDYLDHILEHAVGGATLDQLAEALVAWDEEIALEEARSYLAELAAAQILVSEFTLPVTGPNAALTLLDKLRRVAPDDERVGIVERACGKLIGMDASSQGNPPGAYRELARDLEELPGRVDTKHLVQIDLFKPGRDLALNQSVGKDVLRAVEILHRLRTPQQETALDIFQQKFRERYGEREVPLTEVLDEEIGLGFMVTGGPQAEDSPLLAGLHFPQPYGAANTRQSPTQQMLLDKITAAAAEGRTGIEISDEDLERFPSRGAPPGDALAMLCTVAAASTEAMDAGDYLLRVKSVSGPSGARLLGRFCHLDDDLSGGVAEHLRHEEALNPEAIHAEIVHLPEGRLGNILFRPRLRPWEITLSGSSSVDRQHQITISDLHLRLEQGRLVLRSRRLNREIIPRLSSAHAYVNRSIGLYKFLCNLQLQGVTSGLMWSWGTLGSASFLPRVTCGRIVLSRAAWSLSRKEVEGLKGADEASSFRAMQNLRRVRGLPRLVELVDGDNCLPVDLDNAVSVDTLLRLIRNRGQVTLEEFFPAPDEMPVTGPEGVFAHEFIVPFVRQLDQNQTKEQPVVATPDTAEPAEVFLPGSEWLYAKLYCGTTNADRILDEVVGPLAAEAQEAGHIDRWFFLRYSDPEWHLRLRFRATAPGHVGALMNRLQEMAAPLVRTGVMRDVTVASYTRETARYGGPMAISRAEEMFAADSTAVIGILGDLQGDADARWRLALAGMDMLMTDLGLDLAAKHAAIKGAVTGYRSEFRVGTDFNKKVGKRFRADHKSLDGLIFEGACSSPAMALSYDRLLQRRERWAGACADLRKLERNGELTTSLEKLTHSFIHMHANRLLRSSARAQELVLYDLLCRIYDSRLARARQKNARGHA